jgi:protein-S-isoprenylcysteine O-methyltransferase Ste14
MSFIPEFELGVWNAWIFILLHQAGTSIVLQLMFSRDIWKDVWNVWNKAPTDTSPNKTDKILEYSVYVVFLAVFGYSVFLPLKLNTVWFYVGLPIYLLGVIIDFMAGVGWATNPLDKPITRGVYRISRHPMDFGNIVVIIGIGIACASWVVLLLGIAGITLMNMKAVHEERFCLEKFGNAYREYMNKTPRWIGIPKSKSAPRADKLVSIR